MIVLRVDLATRFGARKFGDIIEVNILVFRCVMPRPQAFSGQIYHDITKLVVCILSGSVMSAFSVIPLGIVERKSAPGATFRDYWGERFEQLQKK